jgi:hypothetical protein
MLQHPCLWQTFPKPRLITSTASIAVAFHFDFNVVFVDVFELSDIEMRDFWNL